MKASWIKIAKEIFLLKMLLLLAVLANFPVLRADLMYPEQAMYYGINHTIHSLADLIQIYTHPKMLDYMAPFFRPSGNFLMYQLLTPWLGWHSTRSLLIVNMLFLGLTGYVIGKLYQHLFPGFKVGGYVAFGFYAMSPGLMLAKISIMHFDFAYIFFTLSGLYFFVVFCQTNLRQMQLPSSPVKFSHFAYLLAAILFYLVAFTFKESAIMLGPVAVCYLLCAFYQPAQPLKRIFNKEVFYIISLWTLVAVILMTYLKMSWSDSFSPLHGINHGKKILLAAKEFSRFLFSLSCHNFIDRSSEYGMLSDTKMPLISHVCTWILLFFTAVSIVSVFKQNNSELKRAIVFLLLAILLFMLIPLSWAIAYPWHLSLSFAAEGILLGFGYEYYVSHIANKRIAIASGIVMALLLAVAVYKVDAANISFIETTRAGFFSTIDRNAVFHPPAISNKFNADTILVVQDKQNIGDYPLGNSTYPALAILQSDQFNFEDTFVWGKGKVFFKINPVYNGTLFRWAYLLPNLKEEVIPFTSEDMSVVTDVLLLDWVRHLNNIYCVTYDTKGNWFDNTAVFKKNVVLEQKKRHLLINPYRILLKTALYSKPQLIKILPYADPGICQTYCDNHRDCKAFTYTNVVEKQKTLAKCFFYKKLSASLKPCAVCAGYIKSI